MELHGDANALLLDRHDRRLRVLAQDFVLLVMSMMDEALLEMVGEMAGAGRLAAESRSLTLTVGMIFV